MNKLWIEASHYHARLYRRRFLPDDSKDSRCSIYEYLDVMGLYETGWMVYDFIKYHEREKDKYGYPR